MSEPFERLTAALSERYRIERELGRGGMGVVLLAEDLKHSRKVAIKVLRPVRPRATRTSSCRTCLESRCALG